MVTENKFSGVLSRILREKSRDRDDKAPEGVSAGYTSSVSCAKEDVSRYDVYTDFARHPLMQKITVMRTLSKNFHLSDPYFRTLCNVNGVLATVDGKEVINFSSYNYLGLNDDLWVREVAMAAVEKYGTSVGASRLVAGERDFQQVLERKIARIYGADDAVVMVSGHATNVSVISTIFGADDLVLFDSLDHNSIIEGIKLSGARYFPYPHNDLNALEALLKVHRHKYKRVLIVTEGLFSMDGDLPDLPSLINLKHHYGCLLMVDEAHALGVLGRHGLGLHEYWAEQLKSGEDEIKAYTGYLQRSTDIWMGTLSKTLSSCGGYVAGCQDLIDILRCSAPGFVYSVGISAPASEASSAAIDIMLSEPERVSRLQANARLFYDYAVSSGLNVGRCQGFAVIPVIIGSSRKAVDLAQKLLEEGINARPIIHPAVEERMARLRFFINIGHTPEMIKKTVETVARLLQE